MAAASKSPTCANNSSQSRRPARGVLSPPHMSLPETVDTVSLSKKLDASCSLGVDDSPEVKKPSAWKKPSNGAASVMGAESWPALPDSARASPKPSFVSEEMLAVASSPRKEATSIVGASTEAQQHNAGNSSGSAREDTHRVWQRGRPTGDNEQHSQNGPLRSNNGPRGDGFQHHRYGARRRENFTSQKRDGPRPFVRGPPLNGPFAPPPIVMPPFVNPIPYHDLPHVYYVHAPHLDPIRPMHMVSYSPMFIPPSDPNLSTKILNQIEYYFSNENLVKDTFLRQNMDGEGWVSIKLIAGFKKVVQLTDNIHLILDAIKASNVVEVQGDKVRRKNDWSRWLMPRNQYSAATSHSSHDSDQDNLGGNHNIAALHERAET